MRGGEIIQLKISDIRKKNDISYISINEDSPNKSVKTTSSIREVPIPDILKNVGFIDYIDTIRKQFGDESSLFPYYKTKNNTKLFSMFSKSFVRLLNKIKAKTEKNSYHSLRHNWMDFVRESEVDISIAKYLGGWADSGGTESKVYGSGYSLQKKFDAINKIKFEGVDIK